MRRLGPRGSWLSRGPEHIALRRREALPSRPLLVAASVLPGA